jgi:hypothetical protein
LFTALGPPGHLTLATWLPQLPNKLMLPERFSSNVLNEIFK